MSETSTFQRIARVVIVPLLVLLVGAAGAFILFKSKPKVERKAGERTAPSVDVAVVKSTTQLAQLTANGTVIPKRQVTLSPEVAGRIIYVNPALEKGGRVKAGETLMRVEATDYSIAAELEALKVENAKANVQLEAGRAAIAKREVRLLGDKKRDENSLALRGPQKAQAEIALKSAEASLRRAQKNLARTYLRAPFNALVLSEMVEIGGYASPQMQAATLIGTDSFYVEAAIPVDKLPLLQVPKGDALGSKVNVIQELGNSRALREGRVVRLAGTLDAESRTANVIIEVKAPMQKEVTAKDGSVSEQAPLFPSAFVTVEIEGGEGRSVITLPDTALSLGNQVYVVDDKMQLSARRVDIVWKSNGKAYVKSGIEDGERVVVSPLANPIEGTTVKIRRTLNDKEGAQ